MDFNNNGLDDIRICTICLEDNIPVWQKMFVIVLLLIILCLFF